MSGVPRGWHDPVEGMPVALIRFEPEMLMWCFEHYGTRSDGHWTIWDAKFYFKDKDVALLFKMRFY